MATQNLNSFGTRAELNAGGKKLAYHSLKTFSKTKDVSKLPFSLKILLENLLRHEDGVAVKKEHIEALAKWNPKAEPDTEIQFMPARVLLQDFTGVPAVCDLAAMRGALKKPGRRSGAHQSSPARGPRDRPLRAGRQVRPPKARCSPTRSSSSSATASATSSCAGARARSRISASSRPTPASAIK